MKKKVVKKPMKKSKVTKKAVANHPARPSTRLKRVREKLKLSQAAMAERLDIPLHSYAGYEYGRNKPSHERRNKMIIRLKELGVNFKEKDFSVL